MRHSMATIMVMALSWPLMLPLVTSGERLASCQRRSRICWRVIGELVSWVVDIIEKYPGYARTKRAARKIKCQWVLRSFGKFGIFDFLFEAFCGKAKQG